MAESTLTYQEYLASLPPDRRTAVEKVWQVVRESMQLATPKASNPNF